MHYTRKLTKTNLYSYKNKKSTFYNGTYKESKR